MTFKSKKFKRGLNGYVYTYEPAEELEEEMGISLPPRFQNLAKDQGGGFKKRIK